MIEENTYPERELEECPFEPAGRLLLEISFDGSNYGGWQIQSNNHTVQEVLQNLLCRLYNKQPIQLVGSSRTDAGVHAIGFAAGFLYPARPAIPPDKLKSALNRLLPPDIRIRRIREMPLNFHARFDARGKAYTYVINLGDETPFSNHFSWNPGMPMDIDKIRATAQRLTGTHDYSSFVVERNRIDNAVRTIYRIEAQMFGNYLCLTYVGNGFLYKMVRCLTGTLAAVGTGRISPERVSDILAAKNRVQAPDTASPRGLFLVKVFYDEQELHDFKLTQVPCFM